MFFNRSKIGIEIRENEIRAALIENNEVTDFSVYEIPSEIAFDRNEVMNFISARTKEFHKKNDNRAKELFCVLSGTEIQTYFSTLPSTDDQQIEQMLKWESERYLDETLDNSLWTHSVVERSSVESKVFISKIEKNIAEQYTALFADLPLKFIGFTSISTALYNLFRKYISKDQCSALIMLNKEFINIVIINDGILRFCRETRCDLDDDVSSILMKINETFAYFGAEERLNINSVTVIGPETVAKELVEKINNSGRSGVYFNISKHITVKKEFKNSEFLVSIAGSSIDTKQFIVSQKTAQSRGKYEFLMKASAAAFAVIAVLFIYQKIQLHKIEKAYENINIKRSEIDPYVKEFESYTQLKQKYSQIETSVVRLLKEKTNWHIVLEKLGSLTPQGVWISSMNNSRTKTANYPLNMPKTVIKITGKSFSYENVLDFKNNLSESGSFKDVMLMNTSSSKIDKSNIVNFTITFEPVNLL